MNNFRELKVWQKSIFLVKETYLLTGSYPKEEVYGLTQQIRRAAVSIPSNIAEGSGRGSSKEFRHFLSIALGSNFELETQLILSSELSFIEREKMVKIQDMLVEVQRMIRGLQKSID